jgi:hypothetical protein
VKTWKQLEVLAKRGHCSLLRFSRKHGGGVTICEESSKYEPLVSIVAGDLSHRHADIVTREATEAALRALKGLDR